MEEYDETYEETEGDYDDYLYDKFRDDLLTEDYDTLVRWYGKNLIDGALNIKKKNVEEGKECKEKI